MGSPWHLLRGGAGWFASYEKCHAKLGNIHFPVQQETRRWPNEGIWNSRGQILSEIIIIHFSIPIKYHEFSSFSRNPVRMGQERI
jgi:hypothetical protein